MPATYVALLRGINLAGKNKIPMADLEKMFTKAGCTNVRTYIQSGNVIFRAAAEISVRLPEMIAAQINKQFGYKVPVMLRTVEEIGDVIRGNPFLKEGAPEDSLHVLFLADLPNPPAVKNLDPNRSSPDTFIVLGKEVYLRLPNGMGRTKLTNPYFDSKLKTISTARNWRTVTKLLELMDGNDLTPRPVRSASRSPTRIVRRSVSGGDAGGRKDAKL
jgi:uncharacterized protein (DUF1697 family)